MHKDSRLLPKGRAVGLGVLKRVLLIVLALAVVKRTKRCFVLFSSFGVLTYRIKF